MASMDMPASGPNAVTAAPATIVKPTYITSLTLAFMTTASVASLRSAPTMAVYLAGRFGVGSRTS
jgi:glutamate:GABA antiporter